MLLKIFRKKAITGKGLLDLIQNLEPFQILDADHKLMDLSSARHLLITHYLARLLLAEKFPQRYEAQNIQVSIENIVFHDFRQFQIT